MKTTSIRLSDKNLYDIEIIRKHISKFFETKPEEIKNSDCIKYALGQISEQIKYNKITG